MTDEYGNDEHECGSDHVRALRLVLAALQSDELGYQLAVSEFIACEGCSDAVIRWLVSMVAGDIAVQSESLEAAASGVAASIAREMGMLSR
ncbi:MAG: hypothetical protein ACLP75_18070 [Mycobacterium sp.]|uniref:hypothetical protein n=1 Tax=Mycobacterium sp. TaxID=1785 RepID=UPI003F9CDB9A